MNGANGLHPDAIVAALAEMDPEQTIGEALKAVTAGGAGGINAQGQVPQDLEIEARNQLFDEEDFVVLRRIPSVEAKSLKHEFQRVTGYGDLHGAAFQDEGGAGIQTALQTEPVQVNIKTVSQVNKVTGEAIDQETVEILGSRNPLVSNRTASMHVLHFKISFQSWFADSRKTTNDRVWAGFFEQHEVYHADAALYPNDPFLMSPDFHIDLRGKPLTREHIKKAARTIYEQGWGRLTDAMMTPLVSEQFQGEVETLNAGRFDLNAERLPDGGMIVGNPIRGVRTQGGDCIFYPDNTISPRYHAADPSENPRWVPYPGAPARPAAAPVLAVTAAGGLGAGDAAKSRWANADLPAGAYEVKYKIQAENKLGLSQSSVASAAVVALAGCRVVGTFNSSADALGYRILRNAPEAPNTFYEIARVKNDGPVLTFTDWNWTIPGMHAGALYEMRYPNQKMVRLPKRAKDNAIAFADLKGKNVQVKPLYEQGDYKAELLFVRRSPQLNQPRRLIRFWNAGNRA